MFFLILHSYRLPSSCRRSPFVLYLGASDLRLVSPTGFKLSLPTKGLFERIAFSFLLHHHQMFVRYSSVTNLATNISRYAPHRYTILPSAAINRYDRSMFWHSVKRSGITTLAKSQIHSSYAIDLGARWHPQRWNKWTKFILGSFCLSTIIGIHYYNHLEVVPIAGRKRYMFFGNRAEKVISYISLETGLNMMGGDSLTSQDVRVQRVLSIANRLLKNLKLTDYALITNDSWEIYVIDEPDSIVAFSAGNKKIAVCSGLLNSLPDDNDLAYAIAHEVGSDAYK
jgi:hypothetical protein